MHFFFPPPLSLSLLLYLEGEWREVEQRPTGGKADESVFFSFFSFLNGTNVSGMLTRGKKEGAKGWRGGSEPRSLARSALGWRGAREEPADFGNPSFINVKPSSAECRLTDITELLAADCL